MQKAMCTVEHSVTRLFMLLCWDCDERYTLSPVDAALEMRSTLGDDNDGKMRTADEGPSINDVCTEGGPKDN